MITSRGVAMKLRHLLYFTTLCALGLWLLMAGCAKKAVVKKDAPDLKTTDTHPEQEDVEASLRGKDYKSIPEIAAVHFDYDKDELTPRAKSILSRNADWLKAHPEAEVKIEGHCDERGTTEYNLGLGTRRAKAIRGYYRALGIPAKRTSTISYGKEKPLCYESTEECQSKNRRAETLVRFPNKP